MKVRVDDSISNVVNELSACKENMSTALKIAIEMKTKIESGKWSGQSKEAAQALMELCIKLHTELNEAVEDNYIVMRDFEDNAEDYMNNSTYSRDWRK